MKVAAVVCAKDEAPRIGAVLDALARSPALDEIVVVDDGSTDGTGDVARRYPKVRVVELRPNRGKGRAMLEGVRATDAGVVAFFDADLVGLEPRHVAAIVEPVARGDFEMIVGLRDYGEWTEITRHMPLISGERAVRRDFLDACPEEVFEGFGVEVRLNHMVHVLGGRTATVVLDGLSIVLKWEKDPSRGVRDMLKMTAEVGRAMVGARRLGMPDRYASVGGADDVHDTVDPSTPVPADTPASVAAECDSTECVLDQLSQSIVKHAGPFARDELWTPEVQERVGRVVARHAARPLWVSAAVGGLFLFGPVGLAAIGFAWVASSDP